MRKKRWNLIVRSYSYGGGVVFSIFKVKKDKMHKFFLHLFVTVEAIFARFMPQLDCLIGQHYSLNCLQPVKFSKFMALKTKLRLLHIQESFYIIQ